jgi:SAM-dependent methyltransferase
VSESNLDEITAANIAFYDRDAVRRDAKQCPEWKHRLRLEVVKLSTEFESPRLLDIGCGVGSDLAFFADQGISASGIDISSTSVAIAKSRGLEVQQMDLHQIALPAGSFDILYSMNGLVHVPAEYLDSVLRDVSRLLVEGGMFCSGSYGGREFQKFVSMESGLRGESLSGGEPNTRFFASYSFATYRDRLAKFFSILHSELISFQNQEFHWFVCRKV